MTIGFSNNYTKLVVKFTKKYIEKNCDNSAVNVKNMVSKFKFETFYRKLTLRKEYAYCKGTVMVPIE